MGDTWIFPHPRNAGPRARHAFSKWWLEAGQLAELEHDQPWGFHALRRQFASELKDEPMSDIAPLGGWKSTTTLLTCYIETDQGTVKRALERRRTLDWKSEWKARMESKERSRSGRRAPRAGARPGGGAGAQVRQDLLDHRCLRNEGDDPHSAVARAHTSGSPSKICCRSTAHRSAVAVRSYVRVQSGLMSYRVFRDDG